MSTPTVNRDAPPPREMPDLERQSTASSADDLPSPEDDLPEVVIYSHSALMYWWPVWLAGFVCAAITYAAGRPFRGDDEMLAIYPGSGLGLSYIAILFMTVIVTSARLRGIYSVVALLAVGFVTVFLAWVGLLDDLAKLVPELAVHMNAGFYLVSSTILLAIWLLSFFVFDRMTYWRIRPGQLTQESLIGDSAESFDARGMLFEKHGEDFLRHKVLGLGAGDLRLTTAGAKQRTIEIPDVLFVDKTVARVQRLIAVEPNDLMT
jgi:hypothetical protein